MKSILIFGLLLLLCCLLSACEVPNGDGTYTTTNDPLGGPSFSQPSSSSTGKTDYRTLAYQDAVNAGIPGDLYVRQINQESGFNPNAVSSAGAIGIAQIIPSTAASWGVNPWDAKDSLKVAADHMHWYYQYYGYNYAKALAAYNAGMSNVASAETQCGLGWQGCLPTETQNYITNIMG